jgi:hypothetical protein
MNQVGHVFSMADVQRRYAPFLPAGYTEYRLIGAGRTRFARPKDAAHAS